MHKFLLKILCKLKTEETGLAALKSINVIDVKYTVAKIYEEMPQSGFIKSWTKLQSNVKKNYGENSETEHTPTDVLESGGNDILLIALRDFLTVMS